MDKHSLLKNIQEKFADKIIEAFVKDIVTIEIDPENLLEIAKELRDAPEYHFETCLDVCGVDYLEYGLTEWRTEEATTSGFNRGKDYQIENKQRMIPWDKPRFCVVYHLLSIEHNHRLRIKVFREGEPMVPSLIDIWPSVNWYEREAFDLYGIVFDGHPDLRRLLTDYGFKGHPFRKDFPLIGEVEMRYDAAKQRCVYEPVSIRPRVLVPKVIRRDSRYIRTENEEGNPNARD